MMKKKIKIRGLKSKSKVHVFVLSKSPSNMKSVLQAGWLLTVAVGNIIVLIIAEAATLEEQVGGFY